MNRRAFGRAAGLAIGAAAASGALTGVVAQGATPAARAAAGELAAMLALAPSTYPWLDEPGSLMISYADIATQLAVTGVAPPETMDDPAFSQWAAATRALAVPMNAAQYLTFWREDYGFDLLQAEATLELSLPPFNLSLFRGQFDHDAIRATLTANGYRKVDVGGHAVLTLRDDYAVDPTGPFAYKLAAMNHVALLDDGTIASASVQAALAAALDVAAGTAPSLMEQGGIAMLAAQAPADLVSGVIISGTALAGNLPASLIDLDPGATPDFDAIATEIAATSEMPPVVTVLVGVTAGGPLIGQDIETPAGVPDARAVAVALMLTPEMAEAARSVVEERLETGASINSGRPFSDLFPAWEVRTMPAAPVLVVDLALGPETTPAILFQMLSSRDLGFLAW